MIRVYEYMYSYTCTWFLHMYFYLCRVSCANPLLKRERRAILVPRTKFFSHYQLRNWYILPTGGGMICVRCTKVTKCLEERTFSFCILF